MKVIKISDVLGLRVFTDSGDFFGEVEEANLHENKVDGWRIRVGGGITSLIGGARGVIIPHQFVKAINDSGIRLPFNYKYFWDYASVEKSEEIGALRKGFRKNIKKITRFTNMLRNRY